MNQLSESLTESKTAIPSLDPLEPKPSNKIVKLLLYLSMSLLLLFLGAAGYWFYENQIQKQLPAPSNPVTTTSPTREPVIISGWKTYRNEMYGFEFKYPENWSVQEVGADISMPRQITSIVENDSIGALLERNEYQIDQSTRRKAFINGLPVERIGPVETNHGFKREYVFISINATTTLMLAADFDDQNEMGLFDQILSTFTTFELTNTTAIPSNDWLTFTHSGFSEYSLWSGYILYYPPSWELKENRGEIPKTLIVELKKNKTVLNLIQTPSGGGNCLYPNDPGKEGLYARYGDYKEFSKSGGRIWRLALPAESDPQQLVYTVCEKSPDAEDFLATTRAGTILIYTDRQNARELEEIYRMLERIEFVE